MTKRTADQEANTMVTETDRNKARSAVVSAYHALDCVTIPFSFLHAFADAAVDAVSTDAEPVPMDDEGRTPMPDGFDDALWRKADEVHHDMALVARDQECVKIIYDALSTHNAEPVKTPFEIASKHIPEARVSLLSRAIRQGLNDYGWKNFGTLPEMLMGYIVEAERAEAAAHAEPVKTAPAVAVKADVGTIARIIDPGALPGTIGEASAIAKAGKVISALSAQVQDVAGKVTVCVGEQTIARLRDGLAVEFDNGLSLIPSSDLEVDDVGPHEKALRDAVEPFLDWLEQREAGAHIAEVREGLIGVEDVIPDDHVVLGAHLRAQKDDGVLTIGHFRRLQSAYDGNLPTSPASKHGDAE